MSKMGDRLPSIDAFRIIGAFRLELRFDNGLVGDCDLSALASDPRPIAAAFRGAGFFDRVYLDYGALTWPNGYDISPVKLYDDMQAAGFLRERATA